MHGGVSAEAGGQLLCSKLRQLRFRLAVYLHHPGFLEYRCLGLPSTGTELTCRKGLGVDVTLMDSQYGVPFSHDLDPSPCPASLRSVSLTPFLQLRAPSRSSFRVLYLPLTLLGVHRTGLREVTHPCGH